MTQDKTFPAQRSKLNLVAYFRQIPREERWAAKEEIIADSRDWIESLEIRHPEINSAKAFCHILKMAAVDADFADLSDVFAISLAEVDPKERPVAIAEKREAIVAELQNPTLLLDEAQANATGDWLVEQALQHLKEGFCATDGRGGRGGRLKLK